MITIAAGPDDLVSARMPTLAERRALGILAPDVSWVSQMSRQGSPVSPVPMPLTDSRGPANDHSRTESDTRSLSANYRSDSSTTTGHGHIQPPQLPAETPMVIS
jgi:hypothetical protein